MNRAEEIKPPEGNLITVRGNSNDNLNAQKPLKSDWGGVVLWRFFGGFCGIGEREEWCFGGALESY